MFHFCLVLEKYNLLFAAGNFWCCSLIHICIYIGMKLLYLLKFVRFVVFNSHWCTVQWGVVDYHEERNNMQICYGVCFILKLIVVLIIYWFIKILRKILNLPKCVYFNKCIKLYCVPLSLKEVYLKSQKQKFLTIKYS